MKDSASVQAAGLLRNKKEKKKVALLALCLSLMVGAGTLAVLHLTGIAMTHESKVLECHFTGEAAHTHNDDCYDGDGNLVCPLAERALHTHDDSCYTANTYLACGLEESAGHVHTDACYSSWSELTCGQEEGEDHQHTEDCWTTYTELTCGIPEGDGAHYHTDDCYVTEQVLTCELPELTEEHVHGEECFVTVELTPEEVAELNNTPVPTSEPMITPEPAATEVPAQEDMFEEDLNVSDTQGGDPWADIEDYDTWNAMFRDFELKGDWDVDLLAVAQSQLGYCESTRNYIVNEAGKYKGYTRYGAWYGSPYGDWCAMFVSFCIRYAGIPAEAMPIEAYCPGWVEILTKWEMYGPKANYAPVPGDLIFFTQNGQTAAHVGLVFDVFEAEDQNHEMKWWVKTIEGNSGNTVRYCTYELGDERILGYGILPEEPPAEDEETPAPAETEPEGVLTDASGELTASEDPQPVVFLQYPEQHFDVWADAVHVRVDAPEGAFPADTTMKAEAVYDADILAAAADSVESEALYVKAVDITFFDAEGNEIEPEIPISVTLSADAVAETEATRVVHIDDKGEPSVIESESENVDVTFDADAFSVYALVGTTLQTYAITADGETYRITVTYDENSGIPADAELEAEEIPEGTAEYREYADKAAASMPNTSGRLELRFFDIRILHEGEELEPAGPVEVRIDYAEPVMIPDAESVSILHFSEDGEQVIVPEIAAA